ncbi:MAG: LpxD N-terminal domain-containing protein [Thiotrichaceae bacterium]
MATHIGAQLENAPSEVRVCNIAPLNKASGQEVSFYTNPLYRKDLLKTNAAAVILASKDRQYCHVPMLVMNNPYLGYAKATHLFHLQNNKIWWNSSVLVCISPRAFQL